MATVLSEFNRLLRSDENTVRRIAASDSGSERARAARLMIRMLDSKKGDLDFRTAENHKVYPINKKTGEIANGPLKGIKVSENGESSSNSNVGAVVSQKGNVRRRRTPKDITAEFHEKSTPGVGKIEMEPGYNADLHEEEIEMAEWLHKTFGGDIMLLKEIDQQHVKTPDYEWNGVLWELKTPDEKTNNAVKSNVREGLHQIAKKPGGIILDISKSGMDLSEAKKSIGNRINQSAQFDVDIIVIYNKGQYVVLRYT